MDSMGHGQPNQAYLQDAEHFFGLRHRWRVTNAVTTKVNDKQQTLHTTLSIHRLYRLLEHKHRQSRLVGIVLGVLVPGAHVEARAAVPVKASPKDLACRRLV